MTEHPYRTQPDRAFWSRAVAAGFSPTDLRANCAPVIVPDDRVVSAGSCFASNLVPWLEDAGITYVRTERPHPALEQLPENLGYRSFSAAYGNIYTARHLRQLLERVDGDFIAVEDRWYDGAHVIDPFRPGLRYPALSDAEFDVLTATHLAAVRAAFEVATVFVFTLGLTEAWVSAVDGATYPACPGTGAGAFDAQRHRFHNFTVSEVRDDLDAILRRLWRMNPSVRIVLTVSPVPLVATATDDHVVTATTYSKAVLRAAAGEIALAHPEMVTYFPAYEIVTGPQAPESYFLQDRRDVSPAAVGAVMRALLADGGTPSVHVPSVDRRAEPVAADPASELSRRVAEAECDEILAEA